MIKLIKINNEDQYLVEVPITLKKQPISSYTVYTASIECDGYVYAIYH